MAPPSEDPSPHLKRPRLVPLQPEAVSLEDGSKAVLLRDPYGVLDGGAVVTPPAYWILAHFDGVRDLSEVAAAVEAAGLRGVRAADVERIARQASDAGLVHGPTYEALRRRALIAFRSRPRPPACAGGAYPSDAGALREMLAGFDAPPRGPGTTRGAPNGKDIRLLVAPHIDFRRGGPTYAHAYRRLQGCDAELFVVFGTAHASPPHLFTLTRQDYETPLGTIPTDVAVVNALVDACSEEELLSDELVHASEHSCEFQLVWLRWVLGDRPFRALPVLCSSISHLGDPAAPTQPFLDALTRATRGRKVCFVAGADLAHVGPQYGDPRASTPSERGAHGARDRRTLRFLAAGDPLGFHRDAVADDERRRLCGVAPIYAAMRAAGRGAEILNYDQWTDGTDMVSFAAAAG